MKPLSDHPSARAPKIGLYCHNTLGLGHIMRSARIAAATRRIAPDADIRIITGCRALDRIALPEAVAIERLEPLRVEDLDFKAKQPVVARRRKAIEDFISRWAPDVMLVDHLPTGLGGELIPSLELCDEQGFATEWILGIPYPEASKMTRPRWGRLKLAIDYYRGVVAYSDPAFLPVLDAYDGFIREAEPRYVGLVTGVAPQTAAPATDLPPLVVVINGGGGTHGIFGEALGVLSELVQQGRIRLKVVGGVLGAWKALAEPALPDNVTFVEAMPVEEALGDASVVVARCGYNSAFALAQTPLPVVFLPEPQSHREQLERAERLADLDRIWCVRPDRPDLDERLRNALDAALAAPFAPRPIDFDFGGAENTARFLVERANAVSGRMATPETSSAAG